jgi:nitroimidazol reductase NimA-like FMN-containing flavoprotein (pyridoxamine 5'-phosphate oxidase superfamily)
MEYRSVIGLGAAVFIEDPTEKKRILNIIMKKYSHEKHHEYDENILKNVTIIKVHIEEMKAKGRI